MSNYQQTKAEREETLADQKREDCEMDFIHLAVGEKWPWELSQTEGTVFELIGSVPLLLLMFDRPTVSEINDARFGKLQMGYYVHNSVIFLVFKLGGMAWMDAPFSVRRYDKYGLVHDWSDGIQPNQGLSIQVSLVAVDTGILHSIRTISTSNAFAKGFQREVLKQLESPYDDYSYDADINEIYSTMTSADIARRADNMFRIHETHNDM